MYSLENLGDRPLLPFCMRLCFAILVVLSFVHFFCAYEATVNVKNFSDDNEQEHQLTAKTSSVSNEGFQEANITTVQAFFSVYTNNFQEKIFTTAQSSLSSTVIDKVDNAGSQSSDFSDTYQKENSANQQTSEISDTFQIEDNLTTQTSVSNAVYQNISNKTAGPPSPVKIIFWVASNNPPTQSRWKRMEKIVNAMKGEGQDKEVCSLENAGEDYPCEFSIASGNVTDADAVIFFMFTTGYKLSELPVERRSEQLWVMYAREPPPFSGWPDQLQKLFNMTLSYRMDSDVWTPYGKTLSLPAKQISENATILFGNLTLEEWISGKSKLVAGVISNCKTASRREHVIDKMNQTSPGKVDVFGTCGNSNICSRHAINCTDFWTEMASTYKFYLAFENALCQDYITEKFWRTLAYGMVPLVYGGGNYSLQAPPHSFIDVRDFDTVEDLMEYLEMLNGNDEEYAKYFHWRQQFSIQEYGWLTHDWCAICKAVHLHKMSDFSKIVHSSYADLKYWWHHKPNSNESACDTPTDFN